MNTLLTLGEAAEFCRYDNKESFRHAVHAYGLPAIRLGKKLLFCKQDLLEHLKSHHNVSAVRSGSTKEDVKCHLSNEVTHGTLTSAHQTDQEYDRVLKLVTSS